MKNNFAVGAFGSVKMTKGNIAVKNITVGTKAPLQSNRYI